eukprot:NODE_8632_length_660_cov_36.774674_g8007_i0.p1 GENE.NODE_8632_length_660_cov_36.774674_g8007_i0~~NODE_8632_length_660_cov_36.774674_g8007_i0.p1  ORF type:complete len:147 (+),score=20.50 NODE_8632_length_660_cov_36.774674_g8007_i0:84-524(+)
MGSACSPSSSNKKPPNDPPLSYVHLEQRPDFCGSIDTDAGDKICAHEMDGHHCAMAIVTGSKYCITHSCPKCKDHKLGGQTVCTKCDPKQAPIEPPKIVVPAIHITHDKIPNKVENNLNSNNNNTNSSHGTSGVIVESLNSSNSSI